MVKTIVNTVLQGECGEEIQIQIIFLLLAIPVCFILTKSRTYFWNAAIPKNKKLTPCFAAFGDECSTHGERLAKSPCHVVFNSFCTF